MGAINKQDYINKYYEGVPLLSVWETGYAEPTLYGLCNPIKN